MSEKAPNWKKIRTEYERGGISHRKLAKKHNVSYNTLKDRATREGWTVSRSEVHRKITAKTHQIIVEQAVKEAIDYNQQHLDDWQQVRDAVVDSLKYYRNPKDIRAISATLKDVQEGQRKALGMDQDKPPDDSDAKAKQGMTIVPADSDDWQQEALHGNS